MDPSIPEPPGSPRLLRARGVGEILVDAFTLYRLHWRNLLAIVAIVIVPLTLVQVLVTDVVLGETEIERRVSEGTNGVEITVTNLSGSDVAALVLAGLTVLVVSVLTWAILTGAITRAAAGTFVGRDLRMDESYRYGVARLGSIILIGVLVALAVLAGLIVFVIPGIFVLTRLSVSIPALVLEDRRGTDALRRSWNLVKGFGWPVFGAIIVSALLTGLFGSLLAALFPDNFAGQAVAETIAAVLTIPYSVLVGILIYFSLRVRKEGYGIDDLERELARTAPA